MQRPMDRIRPTGPLRARLRDGRRRRREIDTSSRRSTSSTSRGRMNSSTRRRPRRTRAGPGKAGPLRRRNRGVSIPRSGHHAVRTRPGAGRQDQHDRQPRRRPGAGARGEGDPDHGPDPGKERRWGGDSEPEPRDGLVPVHHQLRQVPGEQGIAPDRAGEGDIGRRGGGRPGENAPSADRRHDRLGQERGHQYADGEPSLPAPSFGSQVRDHRSEKNRAHAIRQAEVSLPGDVARHPEGDYHVA